MQIIVFREINQRSHPIGVEQEPLGWRITPALKHLALASLYLWKNSA